MELAYYPGCSLHSSSSLYDLQNRKVMAALGVKLRELLDWTCCGATSAGKSDEFMAIAMPARNLGLAEQSGLAELLIPCSACYSRTRVAQQRLEADPALAAEINAELANKIRGGTQVRSILEVLVPFAKNGALAARAKQPLTALRPACYYGCMMTRFPVELPAPDDVENPQGMEIILKSLGATPLEWSYKTDCCGASASVNDQEAAFNLMAKIMKDALARGANCLAVTCPMCQLNLDAYQDQFCVKAGIYQRLPIYFITELIGVALGMTPEELEIDRHFVESVSLLKEIVAR